MKLPENKLSWWSRAARLGRRCGRAPLSAPARAAHPPPQEDGPRTALHYPTTTLDRVLDQSADRFGDVPAVMYADLNWTYRDLRDRVNRLAGGLAHLGVSRGDRVLMTLPNCPEFVTSFMAVLKLGAVVVNAGPLMGVDDVRKLLALTNPCLVIALDLQAPQLETASADMIDRDRDGRLWVSLKGYEPVWMRLGYRFKLWQARQSANGSGDRSSGIAFEALLAEAPPRPPTVACEPDDLAVLQPTGGTTGILKVARLSHRNLLANAMQLAYWTKIQPGQERVLGVLPMFHVYGLTTGLITPLFSAATILPMTRCRIRHLLAILRRYRPSVTCLVPAIIDAVCDELDQHPDPEVCDVFRRTIVISGAAPLNGATAERFSRLTGGRLIQGFGLTEASPVTHLNPIEDSSPPTSIGLPLPDTHTRVVDLQDPTRGVEPGEAGELLISGPQVFGGFYHDPGETKNMLSVDDRGRSWLHTGDVVRVDEDGFSFVIDRKKNMINRAGLKVYPLKVEHLLELHSAVADVAVIGRPDPTHTEIVVALVVRKDPKQDEAHLANELGTLCREHLAPYEVPAHFEFVDELPRSGLGKLLKYRLQHRDGVDEPADEEGYAGAGIASPITNGDAVDVGAGDPGADPGADPGKETN